VTTVVNEYTAAAIAGDRRTAAAIALRFAGGDPNCGRVVNELLAPSQRLIGDRWQLAMCSVGAEHAATFVTETVLASMAVSFEPSEHRGTVVMVCGENEWHSLPSRMATELMIADGWRVINLGPATPAPQLRTYLAGIEADLIGVSVTMPANLTGAARTIEVARQLGVPVICGGAAFDTFGWRARRIGANGQALSLAREFDPDTLMWETPPRVQLEDDWALLEFERDRVVHDALVHLPDQLGRRTPTGSESWREHLANEIDQLVGVLSAALLCDDPSIVGEFRRWNVARATAAGEIDDSEAVFDAVAAVVDEIVPRATRMFV